MIFSALPRLQFDNEFLFAKAHGHFQADANKARLSLTRSSPLVAIKAKCPKDK